MNVTRRNFVSSVPVMTSFVGGMAYSRQAAAAGTDPGTWSSDATNVLGYKQTLGTTDLGTALWHAFNDSKPGSGSGNEGKSLLWIPPGTYNVEQPVTLVLDSNTSNWDVTIFAEGAVINYAPTKPEAMSGPCITFAFTGVVNSASPRVHWIGGRMTNVGATITGEGFFRLENMLGSQFSGITFADIHNGYCFNLVNNIPGGFSEDNRFMHCDFRNCRRFVSFALPQNSAKESFARTRIFDIFGDDNGFADYWIYCPYGTGVYHSYIEMIGGNFGPAAGGPTTSAIVFASGGMGGTVIDGINVEGTIVANAGYAVWIDSFGQVDSGSPPLLGNLSVLNKDTHAPSPAYLAMRDPQDVRWFVLRP